MTTNEKAHQPKKTGTEATDFFTTEEKAQYEVFRNGKIPREHIEEWTRRDLAAVKSFLHLVTSDENVMKALIDSIWARYKQLHEEHVDDLHKPKANGTIQNKP